MIVLMVAGLAGSLLVGCAGNAQGPPSEPRPAALVDPPGIYTDSEGLVRAVGVFDHVALEGGVWAVLGVADSESAESQVIAVIPNAEELETDLVAYRGRYVEVTGTLLEGTSARMAGPEVEARSITVIVEEDPADQLQ
jgi:hypothetical protein